MNRGRRDRFNAGRNTFWEGKSNIFTYSDYSGFILPAFLQFTLIALLLSTASGVLTSLVLKVRVKGGAIAKDALLGAVGSVIALYGLWRLWSQDDWGPFTTGIVVAIVIPILREFYRFKRAGRKVG
jgi:hypothetical protein